MRDALRLIAGKLAAGLFRLGKGLLPVQGDIGADFFINRVNAAENRLGQFQGGDFFGGEQIR